MARTRVADDFAAIHARMEELRRMTRIRAADDFAMIRARVEELRRERAEVLAEAGGRSARGPRPYHRAASNGTQAAPNHGGSRPRQGSTSARPP